MDAAALSGEGSGGDPSYLGQQLIGCLLVLLGLAQGHVALTSKFTRTRTRTRTRTHTRTRTRTRTRTQVTSPPSSGA